MVLAADAADVAGVLNRRATNADQDGVSKRKSKV